MRRSSNWLIKVILLLTIVLTAGCSSNVSDTGSKAVIDEKELDPSVWGKAFPLQYASYMKTQEAEKTDFGGSVKESKFDSEPEILELFKGYGFSKEYNEDRGHVYAVQDLLNSKRVNEKTPGSCLTCKSPSAPALIKEMGADYYKTPLLELAKDVKHPVACADCHDPNSMKLRITRPAFTEAMKKQGIDITKATKKEMRSYVCAQCHVEYHFDKDTKEVILPWDNGLEPKNIEAYYKAQGFGDWEHPDSKANMVKAQHPEFETWSTGTHGSAGVSCADCHMPYMREDGKKYSSHWWTSPLKTIEVSCQTCHKQDAEWLKDRVLNTQTRTAELQSKAGHQIAEAHQQIKAALENKVADQKKIKEAQEMVVKAQWYWDWVAAENSRGFHNPVQSLDSLGQAIDYAHRAKELAKTAAKL